MNWVRGLVVAAASTAAAYLAVEAARRLVDAYAVDVEVRTRAAINEVRARHALDEEVAKLTPWVLWEAFIASRDAATTQGEPS